MSGLLRETLSLLGAELRYHLRDRVMLALMILAPLVVYPALLYGTQRMQRTDEQSLREEVLTVSAPAEVQAWIRPEDHLEISAQPYDREAGSGPVAGLTLAEEDAPATIAYNAASERSQRAMKRLRAVLERRQLEEQRVAFEAAGLPLTPQEVISIQHEEIAEKAQQAGDLLGRYLPITLIFLIAAGGVYTALDVVTGERERKTLETLLTSRADRRAVAMAKFGVVFVISTAMGALSLLSLGLCLAAGLVPVPEGALSALSPVALLSLGVLLVPLLLQITAVLFTVAAYAPSMQAGQAFAAPLVMLLAAPAAVAAIPEVPFTPLLALLPIVNGAMSIRAVLSGEGGLALVALAWVAALAEAGLLLFAASRLLGRETVVVGALGGTARRSSGRTWPEALALFTTFMFLTWFFGMPLQARDLTVGILVSQWGMLVLPTLAAVWWMGLPARETLALRLPRGRDLGLAALAGCLLPGVGMLAAGLQDYVIPTPSSFNEQFGATLLGERAVALNLLLFAAQPGFCEELAFRGGVLGLLRGSLRPWALTLVVAILFGAMHMSSVRFFGTASIGAVLTVVALRSGSVVPGMVMHALNNGLLVGLSQTGAVDMSALEGPRGLLISGLMAAGCVGLTLAMGGRGDKGAS